jgi:hypothetical protein
MPTHHCTTLLFLFLLQPPIVARAADRTEVINDLLSWAKDEGGIVDNIKVGNSSINGAGRALNLVAPRSEGSVLVSVPLNMLVTDNVARADPTMIKHVLSFPPEVLAIDSCMAVTLFLMLEQLNITGLSSHSKWLRYWNSLPPLDHRFNLPQLEWNSTEQGRAALDVLLSSPSMAQRLHKERSLHDKSMEKLQDTVFFSLNKAYSSTVPNLMKKLKQAFVWSKSVILTRSWTKPHSSIAGECTMVPILDLLNHDDQGGGLIAVAFDDQPGLIHSFGVLATKDVGTDEEVFDSYDPPTSPNQIKCVQDMFVGFGFLPLRGSSNRPWCFNLMFPIKTMTFATPAANMAQLLQLKQWNAKRGDLFTIQLKEGDKTLPNSLLVVLRLCVSDEKDIALAQRRGNALAPLSLRNERKVLATIWTVMSKNLAHIPSSGGQDQRQLDEGVNDQMAIALRIRIHERNICVQTLDQIKELWLHAMLLKELV